MEQLFEFLFGNAIVLIGILGAIASWVSSRKKDEEEKPKPVETGPYAREVEEPYEVDEEPYEDAPTTFPKEPSYNYEKSSYDRTRISGEHDAISDQPLQVAYKKQTKNQLNVQINKLNKKRLAEAVVMAEVIGQPRSKRPHSSTVPNRPKREM
ncbi:hypothetical protein N781_11185 [Pontibacillus halophilus JSM 076056 = DSM 19796]|uniref:Uncharacterized protein n=1 Tax=Pontibacillus halophilus JSM 076056 = DSM 19796 TaxID=1385510 RepID=A0A0A5GR52_9BACI|nr:OadG family protein [Pontibacillus halophilus]KGX93640.1 hypothetical protein N781_11185 [Pontibacillus halophilus JSM 076056 = DSM 19796]